MFAQVEGLEDLLQSHHLDNGRRCVTKQPSVCLPHGKLGVGGEKRIKPEQVTKMSIFAELLTSGGRCTSIGM